MMVMLKLRDRTAIVRNVILAERTAIILAALLLWRWGVAAMLAAFIVISAIAALCYFWHAARVSTLRATRLLAIYFTHLLLAAIITLPITYLAW